MLAEHYMQKIKDLSGQKFSRITVISLNRSGNGGKTYWNCICECGSEKVIRGDGIVSGAVLSCGCYCKELKSKQMFDMFTRHGKSGTSLHNVWLSIIQRCKNPNNSAYNYYGGRGITICDRWLNFENFLADIGERPSKDHSIDRISNNGNYEPGNCRWATRSEQSTNRRNTTWINIEGCVQPLPVWAKLTMTKDETIRARLKKGWSEYESVLGR
jgi:hypothetical protein